MSYDYKSETGTAHKWQRCAAILLTDLSSTGINVRMDEEECIQMGSARFARGVGGLEFTYPPDAVIYLRDPETGELTGGTTTFGAMHAAIYSCYLQKAFERDGV